MIEQIIINGYEPHQVIGAGDIPVLDRSGPGNYLAACAVTWPTDDEGCDTPALVSEVEKMIGAPITSFQGCYRATEFRLETSAPVPAATPLPADTLAPTATPAPESHLMRALALTPNGASQVHFSDWALIKEYKGLEYLNSKSSLDERQAFILSLVQDQAAASGYGANHMSMHADVWGWDTTDLAWEATVTMDDTLVYILKFGEDFDFRPVLALFDERDFVNRDYRGATLYSHEMDFGADWLRATEFAILNTAVLADEKMFVLSRVVEGVQTVLDTHREEVDSLASDEAIRATAGRLGSVAAAFISPGQEACLNFGPDPLLLAQSSEEQLAAWEALLRQNRPAHAYTALGVGYRYESNQPIGVIVMHYADPSQAQADLEPRRHLASEGNSLRQNRPYSEVIFTLAEASIEESNLVLQVYPSNDLPSLLFKMIADRDMIFAMCP